MNIILKMKLFFAHHFYWLRKPQIRVYEASLSGNGSFIDIRYWISRPDKVNPKGSIFIVHDGSKAKLYLMQIARFGAIRTRHSKFRNTGNLLFYNRNGLVTHGSKISLQFDNLVATDIFID
jgi:hypothetical protein